MKLTKYVRSAIVNAIMADTPTPSYEQFKRDVQDAMFDGMSPDAQQLYAVKPDALKEHHTYFYCLRSSLSVVCGDADIASVLIPFTQIDRERQKAECALREAVYGFNTTKQLTTAFPEFAKYVPQDPPTSKNLPALTNVVANLSKLGWPVGAVA